MAAEEYRLFEGRPENDAMSINEKTVYDFLDKSGVEYSTLTHPSAFTMEECRKVRDYIQAPVFKNLFLTNKQQTKFYLLVMPAGKAFKTKYLSAQIQGSRLSFASAQFMEHYLGVKPGAVSPLGLIFDRDREVTVLFDNELKCEDKFACHPCVNTASVVMRLSEMIDIIIPFTNHDIKWVDLPREEEPEHQ